MAILQANVSPQKSNVLMPTKELKLRQYHVGINIQHFWHVNLLFNIVQGIMYACGSGDAGHLGTGGRVGSLIPKKLGGSPSTEP